MLATPMGCLRARLHAQSQMLKCDFGLYFGMANRVKHLNLPIWMRRGLTNLLEVPTPTRDARPTLGRRLQTAKNICLQL
jgi:hypothetical protein